MKKKELSYQTYVLVPEAWLVQLEEKLDALIGRPQEEKSRVLGDWITEEEAKQLLGRETTWFWERRKNNELKFTKVGRANYYSLASIKQFLDQNSDTAA